MSKIIIANWKMELNLKQSLKLLKEYKKILKLKKRNYSYIVCPDFLSLAYLAAKQESSRVFPFYLGAQTLGHQNFGALTGEVSPLNLKRIGVNFSLVGHSERRYMGEKASLLKEKILSALKVNIIPVLCLGEEKKLSQKKLENYIDKEIKDIFSELSKSQIRQIIIAYEPVWAIGSNNPCSPKKASQVHSIIKEKINNKFGHLPKVLYGGSINGENAKDYLNYNNIDGLLVGGASLNANKFKKIIN